MNNHVNLLKPTNVSDLELSPKDVMFEKLNQMQAITMTLVKQVESLQSRVTELENNVQTPNPRTADTIKSKTLPLPYVDIRIVGCCDSIKERYGIYGQCMNQCKYYLEHAEYSKVYYCGECIKLLDDETKNIGLIYERIARGDDYRTPKGKIPVKYEKVIDKILEKYKITRQELDTKLASCGIFIRLNSSGKAKISLELTNDMRESGERMDSLAERYTKSMTQQKKRGRPRKVKETVLEDWTCPNSLAHFKREVGGNKLYDDAGEEVGEWSDEYQKIIEKTL